MAGLFGRIERARCLVQLGHYDRREVIDVAVNRIIEAAELRRIARGILSAARREAAHVHDRRMAADIRRAFIRREVRCYGPAVADRLRMILGAAAY